MGKGKEEGEEERERRREGSNKTIREYGQYPNINHTHISGGFLSSPTCSSSGEEV